MRRARAQDVPAIRCATRGTRVASAPGIMRIRVSRLTFWVGSLALISVLAAIALPQLLGAREKARNATVDNIYVALNGEVANELDGALNGGTGQLGPVPTMAAAVVPPAPAPAPRAAKRVVVHSGEMTLTALDVRRAASRAVLIAEQVGGYVAAQTITGGRHEAASAVLSLRVPTSAFQGVTDAIAALGAVERLSAHAIDQTDDHIDVAARLAAKRALESRLLAFVSREPANLGDTLAVEKELARVREEIETLASQSNGLATNVRLASLELRIDEATGAARGFRGRLAERAAEARRSLARAADAAGRVAADTLVLAVPVLVLGGLALGGARWRRTRTALRGRR